MISLSKRHKILRNPALGLLPLLVFSFLIGSVDMRLSIAIALVLSIAGLFVVNRHSRLIYHVSAIALSIALIWSIFTVADIYYFDKFVVVEIIFVLSLIIVRLVRPKIVHRSAKRDNPIARSYLSESFRVAFQTQYGLLVHLMFVLFLYVFRATSSYMFMMMAELITCQVILITIIVVQEVRLRIVDKKLQGEQWLPIVNEDGAVTGRVAKSVAREMNKKYMHPIVRIALIYDGKMYLQERKLSYLVSPGRLDYPFEKYVLFKHEISTTVRECVQKLCGVEVPVRFLLKYVFENELVKRLIFLYVSDIEDEDIFNSFNLNGGKLWTLPQIEDNMGTNTFSECFELEYEYLKSTVLLAKEIVGRGE
jgi:hypothetical protein